MHIEYLLDAFTWGLAIATVSSPISLFFSQKVHEMGVKRCMYIGLAIACISASYGLIMAAGFINVSNLKNVLIIKIISGLFLLYFAVQELKDASQMYIQHSVISRKNLSLLFASVFLLTMANPITILAFISTFATIGGVDGDWIELLTMGFGLFVGNLIWWTILGSIILRIKQRLSFAWLNRMKYFSAAILGVFGLWAVCTAGMMVINGARY